MFLEPVVGRSFIYLSIAIATTRIRTPSGAKNAYRGQERLSTDKGAFTHNRKKLMPKKKYGSPMGSFSVWV